MKTAGPEKGPDRFDAAEDLPIGIPLVLIPVEVQQCFSIAQLFETLEKIEKVPNHQ